MERVELEKLKKEELIELLLKKGSGRKSEVLDIIKREGKVSINDIAKEIGISDRNVSSQLAYLRKDGWNFGKDSKKRIYIEEE